MISDNEFEHSSFVRVYNTNYFINKEGLLFDDVSKEFITPRYISDETDNYPAVDIPGHGTKFIHVLVSECFLLKPNGKVIVNHLDGDKKNPKANNLEYTTYSGNIIHAYKNGLRRDNKQVWLKDLISNRVYVFYSINECARFLGLNAGYLIGYLRKKQNFPFKGKWDITTTEYCWNEIPEENFGLGRPGENREVLVTSRKDKKVYLFSSLAQASSFTGISTSVILARIKKPKQDDQVTDHVRDWEFAYKRSHEDVLDSVVRVLGKEKRCWRKNKKPTPILVEDIYTKIACCYKSVEDFSKDIGYSRESIQAAIYRRGGWNRFKISYLRS